MNPLTVLLPLILIGYLALPALATEFPTKTSCNVHNTDLIAKPAASPHVTTYNTVSPVNAANNSVDSQEKDKPQTWFYHPNSSHRTSINPLTMLLPLLLIGYLALPILAAQLPTKASDNIHINSLVARIVAPEISTSTTSKSNQCTTRIYPPAFSIPTPKNVTINSTTSATGVPLATGGNVTGAMPASSAAFVGSRTAMLEATLCAFIAGLAVMIAFAF